MKVRNKIKNLFSFHLYLTKINKYQFIVNFFAIIIISSVISITFLNDATVKENYFRNELNEFDKFSFSLISSDWNRNLLSEFNSDLRKYEIYEYLNSEFYNGLFLNTKTINPITQSVIFPNPGLLGINKSLVDSVEVKSNFQGEIPDKYDEVILVGPVFKHLGNLSWFDDIKLGNSVNVSIIGKSTDVNLNLRLHVVGKYKPIINQVDTIDTEWDVLDEFLYKNPIFFAGSFITYPNFFLKLFENETVNTYPINSGIQLSFNLKGINLNDLEIFYNEFDRFSKFLETSGKYDIIRYVNVKYIRENAQNDLGYVSINDLTLYELKELMDSLQTIGLISLFLQIPNIILIILFMSLSSSILGISNKQNFQLLEKRGIKGSQLFSNIIFQLIFLFFASIGISVIVILFFNFNQLIRIQVIDILKIIMDFFNQYILLFLGILLIPSILIISTTYNAFNKDLNDFYIESSPFWKKKFIDILILLLGIIGNLFFYIFVFNQEVFTNLGGEEILPILIVLVIVFLPFPFFLLIGGLSILIRIIPFLINLSSKFLWKKYGNISAYTLINMMRNRFFLIRTLILLSFIFTLVFSFFLIPNIIQYNISRQDYYETGADIYFNLRWDEALEKSFASDKNLETYDKIAFTKIFYSQQENQGNFIDLLIIYPNYYNVIDKRWNDNIYSLSHNLLNEENTILISKYISEIFQFKIDDFIEFNSFKVRIAGIYDFWPRFTLNRNDLGFIVSNTTYSHLLKYNNSVSTFTEGYISKLTINGSLEEFKSTYTPGVIESWLDNQNSIENTSVRITQTYLILIFLISLLLIILIAIFTSINRIKNHSTEIAVERALGLSNRQFLKIIIFENLITIFFSNIFGIFIAISFSISIISIWLMILSPLAFPPPIIFINFGGLIYYLAILDLFLALMILIHLIIYKKFKVAISLQEI